MAGDDTLPKDAMLALTEEGVYQRVIDFDLEINILRVLFDKRLGFRELMDELQINSDRPLRRVLGGLKQKRYITIQSGRRRGQQKLQKITAKGRRHYVSNRPLAEFVQGFLGAFDYSYTKSIGGDISHYRKFLEQIEAPLRQMLNVSFEKNSFYNDPYLVIRSLPVDALFEDAKLALKKGHFLSANHRYMLDELRVSSLDKLEQHNILWKKRVQSFQFTGTEISEQLKTLLNPYVRVSEEIEERKGILGKKHRYYYSEIEKGFTRDSYSADDSRWRIDVSILQSRYKRARQRYGRVLRRSTKYRSHSFSAT